MKNLEYKKTVQVAAAPADVYKAYTDPSAIRLWYGSISQLALRRSGHFTHADTTGDVYESGEYLEVKENELLKFRVEHHGFYVGSEVTVAFNGNGAQGTEFSVTHKNLGESDLQHASASWDWAISNLKSYVESGTTQMFKAWFADNKKNYKL